MYILVQLLPPHSCACKPFATALAKNLASSGQHSLCPWVNEDNNYSLRLQSERQWFGARPSSEEHEMDEGEESR